MARRIPKRRDEAVAVLHVTTGLFPVPNVPAASGAGVVIFLSSFQDEDTQVAWSVYEARPDGTKERLRGGNARIGGQGAERIFLRPRDVEGRVIEVNMTLPSRAIRPSVAVVQSFLTDRTQRTLLLLGPSDFALRRTARFGGDRPWGRRRLRR